MRKPASIDLADWNALRSDMDADARKLLALALETEDPKSAALLAAAAARGLESAGEFELCDEPS